MISCKETKTGMTKMRVRNIAKQMDISQVAGKEVCRSVGAAGL
jgi:hypothetical protein